MTDAVNEVVERERVADLLGYVEQLVEQGWSLEVATDEVCGQCDKDEYLEINSLMGMAAQYEYQSMNDIDETIMVDIPYNNLCRMARLHEHLEKNPHLDSVTCYKNAVDVARGFAGLW